MLKIILKNVKNDLDFFFTKVALTDVSIMPLY